MNRRITKIKGPTDVPEVTGSFSYKKKSNFFKIISIILLVLGIIIGLSIINKQKYDNEYNYKHKSSKYLIIPGIFILGAIIVYYVSIFHSDKEVLLNFKKEGDSLQVSIVKPDGTSSVFCTSNKHRFCIRNIIAREYQSRLLFELRIKTNASDIVITEELEKGTNPGLEILEGDSFYVEDYLSRENGQLEQIHKLVSKS